MESSPPTRDAVPESLLEYDQWLAWREEDRDGKATKIPIDPETGAFASTTDPATWSAFATAREQVQFGTEDGVGFVFTENDPIVGVDLDDCRDPETGDVDEWAMDVIETLDSFTEISPSGTGFHVLVIGTLPPGRNRKGDLEVYETARFFTVTADHVEGTPTDLEARSAELGTVHEAYLAVDEDEQPDETDSNAGPARQLDDDELLEKARDAANGEKFQRLWRGDTSGYESQSEADMALCSLLAFWTGGDPHQMDQLFRDSGLMREKWDEQHFADGSTYGEKTIERAIAGTSEFYEPSSQSADADGASATEPEAVSQATEVAAADERVAASERTVIDASEVRRREADHLERIEELQAELDAALEENERLQAALEAEREKRAALEEELAAEREDDGSLFSWR